MKEQTNSTTRAVEHMRCELVAYGLTVAKTGIQVTQNLKDIKTLAA